ncbi:hypothetical protein DSL72_007238 [Monilinia vaccinii-corymbosi]|uniref:2EXR domain-containing protein n=1 Tax=Monilinia vaccinii-corymbosi TaxID=61207 RepID=A0A8A3PM89_9HELO|nr:hypothetical protein DSL72_007238 [Monilinia vaccinii-corymbosi]
MAQYTNNQDRTLMPAPRAETSRLQRFASHLNSVQIPRLRNHIGLRRVKKSGNLSGLIKAEVEPYCQIVRRSDNDYRFPQFAKFPIEIRLQIWNEYAQSLGPRDIPVWRVRNPRRDLATQLTIKFYDHNGNHVQFPLEDGLQHHRDFTWSCPQPDILFINFEARQVGLKFYTQESLHGTPYPKKAYTADSKTGPATIYRHRNGLDRIMPMFDLSNGHEHFWDEHKHQLEGLVALNAFLYDLDPNQPILPREPPFMSTDPFLAREARERYALEVAKAWAAVVPSTDRAPASRAIGNTSPFNISEILIYYRTDSLKGVKDLNFGIIDEKHLSCYEGCQAMCNMKRAIKCSYQRWDSLRYNFWIRYTNNMLPETYNGLIAALSNPEAQAKFYRTQWLCLTMVRDSPLLQQKYAARLAFQTANPRGHWLPHLEASWERRVPILPKIQFAICRVNRAGISGIVRPAAYKLR